MKTKKQRLKAIEDIIRSEKIRSQDDLQKSLKDKGFDVTQATLSRDMRQLKIVKAHNDAHKYVYVLPDMTTEPLQAVSSANTATIEFSGNLALVKTRPGYAMGIASDIDEHSTDEILGTIAGDDTILVIPRDGYTKDQIINILNKFLINDKSYSGWRKK